MRTIQLPRADGTLASYTVREPRVWPAPTGPIRTRVAYAAAQVVCDPHSDAELDWDATLAYRRHLWSLGLGVAEAMDTAQRGMGLDWPVARELIGRSLAEARAVNGLIACGAGTDHLAPDVRVTLDAVERGYEEQVGYVEGQGGRVILMASRALARAARGPADYRRVYGTILRQVRRPVILHWLGDMFDPQLAGYWGAPDLDAAMEVCLDIIGQHQERVDGIKISLLDPQREIEMRARLPAGVRMYTGDDFNYDRLILGRTAFTATRCSASSTRSRPLRPRRCRRSIAGTWRATAPRSTPPFRCRATSSSLPHPRTRRASSFSRT